MGRTSLIVGIEGLSEISRALRSIDADLPKELRRILADAAREGKKLSAAMAPGRGRMAGTITIRARQTGSLVGSLHPGIGTRMFGRRWPVREHTRGGAPVRGYIRTGRPNPFIPEAIAFLKPKLQPKVERQIADLIDRAMGGSGGA